MKYYFAYGSNMDQEQMRERCPNSKLVGKAVLKDYRIAFTIFSPKRRCGCADIIESEGSEVWGLLYEVTRSDLASLDRAEGHPDKYERIQAEVIDAFGNSHSVETYKVANIEGNFIPPSRHYLGLMQKAANLFDFPKDYRAQLIEIKFVPEAVI